jgi:hypothetical protein
MEDLCGVGDRFDRVRCCKAIVEVIGVLAFGGGRWSPSDSGLQVVAV